jgi:poly-gamma-glutamate synthesis protein (capsule biosynthesis protein)
MAMGDTGPAKASDLDIFAAVLPHISKADIRMAQVERLFTTRGSFQEATLGFHSRVEPSLVQAYTRAGIDVVGLASNHSLDWGIEGLTDTLDCFRDAGRKTLGVGRTLREAREPVVLERNGVRVGLLGYCSVLSHQSWATEDKPGCAPLRATTCYTPYEYQPGTPAKILTAADADDMAAMVSDIRELRGKVDYVICSMHWGVHWVPRYIADYQRELAHKAIDAGCDLIIGHHAHLLKGIELYKGKAILYSIGNFAMGRSGESLGVLAPEGRYRFADVYDMPVSPDYTYRHKQYYKHSVLVDVAMDSDGTLGLELRPVYIEDGPRPVLLARDDPRFEEVRRLLEWSSEPFGTRLGLREGAVVIL